ncbi:unnamed protein product [Polarella glacialis]|uniref:Uncharacterized protein n=1 Tax=Polarella glacialis TaxID=89957 RepID=A0A813DKG8_POLGL|nr:unnamed protein product [Polarella glacialis]
MRAVGGDGHSELVKKTLLLVAKLTLKQELEIRELQSAVFRTYLLDVSNPFVNAIKESVGEYIAQSKKHRDGSMSDAPEGEIHAHAWNAITTVAMAQKIEQSSQAAIATHRAAITSPKDLSGIIYIAKLKKAWAKNTFKLHLAAHPSHQDLLDFVEAALASSGATPKKGQAPASGMARELQTLVDELAEIAK